MKIKDYGRTEVPFSALAVGAVFRYAKLLFIKVRRDGEDFGADLLSGVCGSFHKNDLVEPVPNATVLVKGQLS